jgi:hypothetical protein
LCLSMYASTGLRGCMVAFVRHRKCRDKERESEEYECCFFEGCHD